MIKKIDVYSIGAVFYEMIFNQRLHNGISQDEVMLMNAKGGLNCETLKCLVDETEMKVLTGLLERNPKKRMSL